MSAIVGNGQTLILEKCTEMEVNQRNDMDIGGGVGCRGWGTPVGAGPEWAAWVAGMQVGAAQERRAKVIKWARRWGKQRSERRRKGAAEESRGGER